MEYPDLAAVDALVHGAFASHNFTFANAKGEQAVDEDGLKDAVFQLMVNEHVVDDPAKLTEGAVTAHELYEAVLPNGPGARQQPVTIEEAEGRKKLMSKLWGFTNTGTSGYCQQRAEAEGFTFVLCEAKVGRTYRSEETGRPKPTTEIGRFLTDDANLINQHSTLPSTLKLTKAAEAVSKHMQMAVRRHPELAPVVARQVGSAVKQAQLSLAPVADAKAALALTAPRVDEDTPQPE